jgi:hypothetical protein
MVAQHLEGEAIISMNPLSDPPRALTIVSLCCAFGKAFMAAANCLIEMAFL